MNVHGTEGISGADGIHNMVGHLRLKGVDLSGCGSHQGATFPLGNNQLRKVALVLQCGHLCPKILPRSGQQLEFVLIHLRPVGRVQYAEHMLFLPPRTPQIDINENFKLFVLR